MDGRGPALKNQKGKLENSKNSFLRYCLWFDLIMDESTDEATTVPLGLNPPTAPRGCKSALQEPVMPGPPASARYYLHGRWQRERPVRPPARPTFLTCAAAKVGRVQPAQIAML
jgi:hypothetical protein